MRSRAGDSYEGKGDWRVPSTWVGQKGQNRRLVGPGARSLTLVAALAQLQGDDLPGHRCSDVGAPARLCERHHTDESLATGRAGRGDRALSSSFDAGDRSARVQYRPPRGQRARMPNLGIIFPPQHLQREFGTGAERGHAPPATHLSSAPAR